uniref:THAP-type domain-containing protein n=1 Tax=Gouania willdenowi TaxID=441366 RepID=A0A8C5HZS1_GOUWI
MTLVILHSYTYTSNPVYCALHHKQSSVHYHLLPTSNKARLKKRLPALTLKDFPDKKFSRVCSEHFCKEDYKQRGKFNTDSSFVRVRTCVLKAGKCPSVFDFSSFTHKADDCPTPETPSQPKVSHIVQMFAFCITEFNPKTFFLL